MKWLREIVVFLLLVVAYSAQALFWSSRYEPRLHNFKKRGLRTPNMQPPHAPNPFSQSSLQKKEMINAFFQTAEGRPLKVFDLKTTRDHTGQERYQLVKPEPSCEYIVIASDHDSTEQQLNKLRDKPKEPVTSSYREAVRQELGIPTSDPLPLPSQPMMPVFQESVPSLSAHAAQSMHPTTLSTYHQPMQPIAYQPQYAQHPYVQPNMQPMYQQPHAPQAYPTNGAQVAALAMQLQASAIAMQAQASAMMMQLQQQVVPAQMPHAMPIQPGYGVSGMPGVSMPSMQTTSIPDMKDFSKDKKMSVLVQYVQQLSHTSQQDIHRLLLLLDTEFDIIEHLLAGASGQIIDRLVSNRTSLLRQSSPLIVRIYDLALELAASGDAEATEAHVYHYFIHRGRRAKERNGIGGKKKFLLQMMYRLEQYYQMIESMQRSIQSISS